MPAKPKRYKVIRDGQVIFTPVPGTFAGIKTKMIFGTLDCPSGKRAKPEHRVFFRAYDDAIKMGYRPCKICKPVSA